MELVSRCQLSSWTFLKYNLVQEKKKKKRKKNCFSLKLCLGILEDTLVQRRVDTALLHEIVQ